jgi:SAM-dependent methyltransferase
MDLSTLRVRRQWNRLGKRDPLWAVLTLGDKRGGAWEVDEFFSTGRKEIQAVIGQAQVLGLPLRRRRAVDFGCGVGRLTQALCDYFGSSVGLDIAPSMIEEARRFNRFPEKCHYELNKSRRLEALEDGSVSFIYTSLVLQHNPPDVSRDYIREFVRTLEWGGLLVMQLPSQQFPCEEDAEGPRTVGTTPLAASDMRARIVPTEDQRQLVAGETTALKLRIENLGGSVWSSLGEGSGKYQVRLGSSWYSVDGQLLSREGPRMDLPRDVPPGDGVEMFLPLTPPAEPGAYALELDMVQEHVAWFSEKGGATARVRLDVCGRPGQPVLEAGVALRPPQPPPRAVEPFKVRHPRLYRLLDRTRLVPLCRAARGRSVLLLANVDAWRLRAWARWRQRLKALVDRPPMEMHGVPKAEVVGLIARSGGTLLWAEESEQPRAGWQGYRYWVTRWPSEPRPEAQRLALHARIEWRGVLAPVCVTPEGEIAVALHLTNLGMFAWPATGSRPLEVLIGGHALDEAGQVVEQDLFRIPLPCTVLPGEGADVDGTFRAPRRPGRYSVRLDLVVEGLSWFETHGSPTIDMDVEVVSSAEESHGRGR